MDKRKILDDIFANDPYGLLTVKPKPSLTRTADERLLASFQEITDFIEKNGREPEPNPKDVAEYQLYSRLKSLRENEDKILALKPEDMYGLLDVEKKEITSIEDILSDDSLNILGDDSEGLYDLKHVKKQDERASADFVARRKPCDDFAKYENLFKEVQGDLANEKRKLIKFKEDNLRAGDFYVHNGILLLLENVDFEKEVQQFKSGSRVRKDGRTRIIFENGTESNMLYRSLYKSLLANGRAVTRNIDKVNEGFMENFGTITEEDEEVGYIYVLKSKSTDERITSIENLYKIGYSKTDVQDRIKNAQNEPTYLMAPVEHIAGWKCFNMNPQKLEQLLHNFFGNSCLEIDVFDSKGKRHTPLEWFIAPIEVIEQAIELIITGKIVDFKYDSENLIIGEK